MINKYGSVSEEIAILMVKNLDGILIGPYDLSASMGIPGKFKKIKFKKALEHIKTSCKNHKISCGLHLIDPSYKKLKEYIRRGYNFIPYSTDTHIINQAVEKLFKKKVIR